MTSEFPKEVEDAIDKACSNISGFAEEASPPVINFVTELLQNPSIREWMKGEMMERIDGVYCEPSEKAVAWKKEDEGFVPVWIERESK